MEIHHEEEKQIICMNNKFSLMFMHTRTCARSMEYFNEVKKIERSNVWATYCDLCTVYTRIPYRFEVIALQPFYPIRQAHTHTRRHSAINCISFIPTKIDVCRLPNRLKLEWYELISSQFNRNMFITICFAEVEVIRFDSPAICRNPIYTTMIYIPHVVCV